MATSEKPQTSVLTSRPEKRSKDHHVEEWASGTRGGGSVPEDFGWKTNPKQWQEELGSATPKKRFDE